MSNQSLPKVVESDPEQQEEALATKSKIPSNPSPDLVATEHLLRECTALQRG